jgi:glycosyltransferase involved in cell wall biosynthesis
MRGQNSSRSLRIALVPPLWARVAPATQGGVEYLVYLLAEELLCRGHQVTVFTASDSPTRARIAALCEWNLIEAMEKGHAAEYEYYETCNIAEALQESDAFDVVHFHVGCYAIPLGNLSRVPVLHTLHNPITSDAIWLLGRYPNAAMIAVSREQIAKIPEDRRRGIRVIYDGCDFEAYEFSSTPGKYLAFLGRMGPEKSPLDAIRIAKQAGLPIILAGQPLDEKERAYFAEKIEPLINGKDVIYVGQVDYRKKVDLLKGACAFLFPIQWDEPFGLVMIEAMACGTPVIALQRGSVEEVVDLGKTGFYAKSIHELSSLVPQALSLDRRTIRDHARQRFGHARMTDEYLQAYESVLNFSWNRRADIVSARQS